MIVSVAHALVFDKERTPSQKFRSYRSPKVVQIVNENGWKGGVWANEKNILVSIRIIRERQNKLNSIWFRVGRLLPDSKEQWSSSEVRQNSRQ